tara:strand:- start:184 stop:519 length:336 start_codon:yes stop_codon:yes gene_type:complete
MSKEATQLISELQDYIAEAKASCERGEFSDIAAMQPKVEQMCQVIGNLPVSDARQHSANLEAIAIELDELKAQMEEKRNLLRDDLQGTTQHSQAAKAYAQPMPPSGEPQEG